MNKSNEKSRRTPYDGKRALAIKWVAEKFGLTEPYVRNVLNGWATTGSAEEVKKAYREKHQELSNILS